MIFADSRFNRHDKRSKLPKWTLQFLNEGCLNLSTDTALAHVKSFLRLMGQPIDQQALQSVLLILDDEVQKIDATPNDGCWWWGNHDHFGEWQLLLVFMCRQNGLAAV